ncbi:MULTISPECIES: DUF1344 domain-containing protein [unclassified Mesorhizobium]|uniref:DUF1344 domain-containing protein n=1 Tax=unclassified Mesorhizobium TaxID=325217 RepID=UPI001128C2CD|nr:MULTISPECIES: DUF1344 domain-containing protein [unclassified Mesorhizobium]TPM10644.1 DUF1344 domain-containing protein [Mesorhizobium sp. B2-3-8]TPM20341.1 DUF1344 domain-containing protein [Mesorhizobium sp. B2-3-7]
MPNHFGTTTSVRRKDHEEIRHRRRDSAGGRILDGSPCKTVTSTIVNVDAKGDAITLADGKTLNLPEGIEVETLKPGKKVIVTYSTKSGKSLVSNIQPAK